VHNPLTERRAGVLLHPTSLPGESGHGELGRQALRFVDFLATCGFTVWQTLPLGPTHADGSPYQCLSVHAGNAELICLRDLVKRGWLDEAGGNVHASLARAWDGFGRLASKAERRAWADFRETHDAWLLDYARYQTIRNLQQGASWYEWPAGLRDRETGELARLDRDCASAIEQVCFEQFIFFEQWHALRDYARRRGVLLFGDIPIYVAHDSADVWTGREYFSIDDAGQPDVVAGVPPDYFSATGQRWGNPLYRWDRMAEDGYRWWIERFRSQLDMFDIVRLDHFRGFEKYWEIPADSETAVEGVWRAGPGAGLFEALTEEFGPLPLVAEDLGSITPEVDALRDRFGMPGMKIMQFAFEGGPENPYLPQHHTENAVVYTGTHDNETTLGWFEALDEKQKKTVYSMLGNPQADMPWALIEAALASSARLAILPMQDVLALGGEHRMNTPGTMLGNWSWQFDWGLVPEGLAARMHDMLQRHDRLQG
jgi:4-alpha-glucanotransferase